MRDAGVARVAVLDVDYHGNGTQAIFYDRADVFFASIHGDPAVEYLFFAGFADETAAARAWGCSTCRCPGTGAEAYGAALDTACAAIAAHGAQALVVSLGVDTFAGDPISHFRLGQPDFTRIGARGWRHWACPRCS
jgi:acetoin utilization deacetylase AcuC-like enzyme